MPNTPDSTTQAPDTVHRTARLRPFPGDAATGILRGPSLEDTDFQSR